MPIRIRLLFLILCGFISLFFSLRYFLHNQMQASFLSLEAKSAREAMDRAFNAIESEKNYLEGKALDWAVWDETYHFVRGSHKNYMQLNIPDVEVFLKNLKVDFFLIANKDGKILASGSHKNESSLIIEPISNDFKNLILKKSNKFQSDRITDFIHTEKGPVLFTAIKIKMSNGLGDSAGFFVIGSYAQKQFAKKIGDYTQLNLSLTYPVETSSSYSFQNLNDFQSRISNVIIDSNDNKILKIMITKERDVFSTYVKTSKSVEKGLLMVIIVNFLIGIGFIVWQVLRPLSNYIDWLSELSRHGNLKGMRYPEQYRPWKWLGMFNRDEFNELIQSSNSLLDKIEESAKVIERQTSILIAAEKFRSLGEMSAGVAHEINNPLAIVMANATRGKRLLNQISEQPAKIQDMVTILEKIESNCSRISKIITGLLSFSRNSSRDEFIQTSASIAIRDAVELVREKAKLKSIKLEVDVDDLATISARNGQITQVIYNLLNNAVDANEFNSEPWIRVKCSVQPGKVKIEVVDSGPGIPASIREKIMEPFFTTKGVGKGTGLGLSISLGIIQEHKGTLTIDANHSNTCFVIELPSIENQLVEISESNKNKVAS